MGNVKHKDIYFFFFNLAWKVLAIIIGEKTKVILLFTTGMVLQMKPLAMSIIQTNLDTPNVQLKQKRSAANL